MSELQIAVVAMCLMGIAFAWCVKCLFDAFVVHLQNQSALTDRAVKQAGEAVALNGRILEAFTRAVKDVGMTSCKP
jgi:hypothetical protein